MSFSKHKFIVQQITTSDDKKNITNYYYSSGTVGTKKVETTEFEVPYLSNSEKIVKLFIKLIKADDYNNYFTLLDDVYVWKFLKVEQEEKESTLTTYAYCQVRQILEAIYYVNTQSFIVLIDALLEKNDERYYAAFFETIRHNTTLDPDKLFTATAESKFEAYEVIRDVEAFSTELKTKLLRLVTQLDANVGPTDYQKLLNNLRLKCEVLELLKENINLAARVEDNGPACTAINLLTILFFAAIPNVINFIATCGKDFLFFNKKTPRNLAETIGVGGSMLPHQFCRSP